LEKNKRKESKDEGKERENKKEMQTVHLVLSLFYELLKKEKEDELVKRKEKRNEDGNRLKAFPKRQTDHL